MLDEADMMTPDAQAALRRIMEAFARSTRFIIICNYVHKFVPLISVSSRIRCSDLFASLGLTVSFSAKKSMCRCRWLLLVRIFAELSIRSSAGALPIGLNLYVCNRMLCCECVLSLTHASLLVACTPNNNQLPPYLMRS